MTILRYRILQTFLLWLVVSFSYVTCLAQIQDNEGLRTFEFPNDQPGAAPAGGGYDSVVVVASDDPSDDLFRQGITNGTVVGLFPGERYLCLGTVRW